MTACQRETAARLMSPALLAVITIPCTICRPQLCCWSYWGLAVGGVWARLGCLCDRVQLSAGRACEYCVSCCPSDGSGNAATGLVCTPAAGASDVHLRGWGGGASTGWLGLRACSTPDAQPLPSTLALLCHFCTNSWASFGSLERRSQALAMTHVSSWGVNNCH